MSQVAKIEAQIAKLTEKLAAAKVAEANNISLDKLVVGVEVAFDYGRAENRTLKSGFILGVKVPAEGTKGQTLVKVQIGQGFDAEIATIYPANIKSIIVPVTEETAAE